MTMQGVTMKRSWMTSLLACASLATVLISAQETQLEYEQFYYNDQSYLAISPGGHSANPNQFEFDCFRLGPDLNGKGAIGAIPLYAVFWPGGTHSCADSILPPHDHVASAIPGAPGFTPHWRLVLVVPIPDQVDEGVFPLTSVAAVEAAAAAGHVMLIDTGLIANAPAVRRSGL